jgi:hypothetical protein
MEVSHFMMCGVLCVQVTVLPFVWIRIYFYVFCNPILRVYPFVGQLGSFWDFL